MSEQLAGNILSIYQQHADTFSRERSQSLFEKPWLDKFIDQVDHQGRILDIGCGTGQPIAEYFIHKGFKITGIDGAAAMINTARDHFPGERWLEQDMRTLALGETFDGIIAWDSFFHLTHGDQHGMFQVFDRHTHPGSALIFTSGPSHGIATGNFAGEVLFHASLAPDAYRGLLAQHGFDVIDMQLEDPDCAGHTVWLAKKTAR
ncbi:class I SAM-dependent methyltransferase [Atlantibacter sp.]|uniref:class I SAM-dependent DNA methyltransferase n=1 Tax=Atlantibacter sp. TaxID=1903473 RepID=UPI0028B023ED|nr:class I SAM-dependent methyltransferase [Atlantibacter sp.]